MAVVIDACCMIDLLASGQFEAILQATGYAWHLPTAVQAEVEYVRQHDPAQPGSYLTLRVDLSPHLGSGLLTLFSRVIRKSRHGSSTMQPGSVPMARPCAWRWLSLEDGQ